MKDKNVNVNKETQRQKMSFAAIEPYWTTDIVSADEKELTSQKFVQWGDRNAYPQYIWELYMHCPTFKTVVNGIVDYVVGDGCSSTKFSDEKTEELVRDMAFSYALYGGFAINVLRNKLKKIADIQVLDFKNVRSDKKNELIYYSPDFSDKKSIGRCKTVVHSSFSSNAVDVASSIYFFKNCRWTTYPLPLIGNAVKAAEIENAIANFQLSEVKNGFVANTMISFNNGIPTDEDKAEIEELINEKFCSPENAGQPLISYSNDKEHATEVIKIDSDNFIDRYNSASDKARQDIFTAFRCNPVLFGINPENKGFSDNDFQESFKLFNRTMIMPIQKVICNAFDKIFGGEDNLTIKPFTIDFSTANNTDKTTVE